jgi:hypothetical protein
VTEFLVSSPHPYSAPTSQPTDVKLEPGTGDHLGIYRNLHAAVRHGTPLIADGLEGRNSLEVANAMIYSSHTHQEVKLPLDRLAYADLLEELRARGPGEDQPVS